MTYKTLVPFSLFLVFSIRVAQSESDYYPLTPGMSYVYEITASFSSENAKTNFERTMSAVITHLEASELQGKKVTPEKHYLNREFSGLSFVADDHTGVYYYAMQGGKSPNPVLMKPIQYLFKYPLETGVTWSQRASEFETLNDNKKIPVTLEAFIESREEIVSVPAGVYAKCLKIRMTGSAKGSRDHIEFRIEKEFWYAPGMGLIRELQQEERIDNSDPAKNQKFVIDLQLQKFRVSRQELSAK